MPASGNIPNRLARSPALKSVLLAVPLRCCISSYFLQCLACYYHRPADHDTLVLATGILFNLQVCLVFNVSLSVMYTEKDDTLVLATESQYGV